MKTDKHLSDITAMADLFIDLESSLEQYYDFCAKIFSDEKFAWFGIATQEGIHAKIFRKMKEEMIQNPEQWELGKYNYEALKTMVDSIHQKLQEIRGGKYVSKSLVVFAKDVEYSLIESDIINAFVSKSDKYPSMVKKIIEETTEHKDFMNRFLMI